MAERIAGIVGTIQLNGALNDPICYVHLNSLPPAGTLLALPGDPPTYYRVHQAMLVVRPITEGTLAAIFERAEAGAERIETVSNQCVIFVEPFQPQPMAAEE